MSLLHSGPAGTGVPHMLWTSCKFKVEFIVQSNCHWSASTIILLYAAIKNMQVDGQTCNLHCFGTCVLFLINVLNN